MKILLHNFFGTLRRFRRPTTLNQIGLSVAFVVFLILMMQVTYEWGFDRFHKHADRLYRLEITHGTSGRFSVQRSGTWMNPVDSLKSE